MGIELLCALSLIGLTPKEKKNILSIEPVLECGMVVFKKDKRHTIRTTPGRFLKRNVPRLSSEEVKVFAEMLTAETKVVITDDLQEIEKAYTEVKSCMSNHTHLLPVYINAGMSLAISYLGDRIIGRMLVTKDRKCNTGYGNFIYLDRYLLNKGYEITEDWLDGVAFKPIKIDGRDCLPYLDTYQLLKLVDGHYYVSNNGEFDIEPHTHRVVIASEKVVKSTV